MATNYGRVGGEVGAKVTPAVAQQQLDDRCAQPDYTPLEQRALLAYLDRRDEQAEALVAAVSLVAWEILETETFEVVTINPPQEITFTVDGQKFKTTIGTRSPGNTDTGGNRRSNSDIQGIHDEEYRTLTVFIRSGWYAVGSLADLGQLLKEHS
jgi:hypothetical protein